MAAAGSAYLPAKPSMLVKVLDELSESFFDDAHVSMMRIVAALTRF